MPLKPQWSDIRETVFGWTPTRFPFQTSSAKHLKIGNPLVIKVIGKAFGTSVTLLKIKAVDHMTLSFVYDDAANVIETHEHKGEFKEL